MTVLLVLIIVLLLLIFGSLLMVMFLFGQTKSLDPEKEPAPAESKPLPFQWKAIVLPVTIFLLVLVMVLVFYGKLPEEVASRYTSDGIPTDWTTRGTLITWTLLPQGLLTLLALLVTWGVTRIRTLALSAEEAGIKIGSLLAVMGNMIALPQLILGFTILNTFGYNAYDTRILPIWAVVLIVILVSIVVLGTFFISTVRKVWMKGNK